MPHVYHIGALNIDYPTPSDVAMECNVVSVVVVVLEVVKKRLQHLSVVQYFKSICHEEN